MTGHGDIKFSWYEDILIIEPKGPFNLEGQKRANKILIESITKRNLTKWRRFEIWNNNTMGSPEVLDLVSDLYDWFDANGCQLTVVVNGNCIQKHLITTFFNDHEINMFSNLNEAKSWMDNHPIIDSV